MEKVKAGDDLKSKKEALEQFKYYEIKKDVKGIQEYDQAINQRKKTLFEPSNDLHRIAIADIQFAYENHELISLLTTRGQYIKDFNFAKLKEVDEKIDELIRSPKSTDLQRPVCAFITFESELGQSEALKYTKDMYKDNSWIKKLHGRTNTVSDLLLKQ